MAMGHLAAGDFDGALAEARYAHDLNPNDVLALRTLGWVEAASGETAAASEHLHQALRSILAIPSDSRSTPCWESPASWMRTTPKAVEWGLLSVSRESLLSRDADYTGQNLVGDGRY